MSAVFRHGALRLYLLKLLDEQPRHGYDVISQLEDRFFGLYSPSAGTIYPRLARLEQDGLVEHDDIDGRKTYRLTDAGREELARNTEELHRLEADLMRSVKDLARDVRSEVRESVRGLREELKRTAREVRQESRAHARHTPAAGSTAGLAKELALLTRDVLKAAYDAEEDVVDSVRATIARAREDALNALRNGSRQPAP